VTSAHLPQVTQILRSYDEKLAHENTLSIKNAKIRLSKWIDAYAQRAFSQDSKQSKTDKGPNRVKDTNQREEVEQEGLSSNPQLLGRLLRSEAM